MIKRVAFTMLQVSKIEDDRKFYEEILGLKPGYEVAESWVEYDIGGTCFGIYRFNLPWASSDARSGNLALEVTDLNKVFLSFKEKRVEIVMEPMKTPVCLMGAVKDFSGNVIILHQLHE